MDTSSAARERVRAATRLSAKHVVSTSRTSTANVVAASSKCILSAFAPYVRARLGTRSGTGRPLRQLPSCGPSEGQVADAIRIEGIAGEAYPRVRHRAFGLTPLVDPGRRGRSGDRRNGSRIGDRFAGNLEFDYAATADHSHQFGHGFSPRRRSASARSPRQ